MTDIDDLDPRYEWHEVQTLGDDGARWIRGGCLHAEVVPVETVDGELVAHLCTTCDQQLPGGDQ